MPSVRVFVSLAMITVPFSGCATYSTPILSTTALSQQSSYLYGRFTVVELDKDGLIPSIGHLRCGLVIESTNKDNTYHIQFNTDETPSAIAVAPGTYSIRKFTFAAYDYVREGEKEIASGPLTLPFSVQPGKAYYLGDIVVGAEARLSSPIYSPSSTIIINTSHTWKLSSVADNYKQTTEDLIKVLPQLGPIEKASVTSPELTHPQEKMH